MTFKIILRNKNTNEDAGYWTETFKYREDAINHIHHVRTMCEKSTVYPADIEYEEDKEE